MGAGRGRRRPGDLPAGGASAPRGGKGQEPLNLLGRQQYQEGRPHLLPPKENQTHQPRRADPLQAVSCGGAVAASLLRWPPCSVPGSAPSSTAPLLLWLPGVAGAGPEAGPFRSPFPSLLGGKADQQVPTGQHPQQGKAAPLPPRWPLRRRPRSRRSAALGETLARGPRSRPASAPGNLQALAPRAPRPAFGFGGASSVFSRPGHTPPPWSSQHQTQVAHPLPP